MVLITSTALPVVVATARAYPECSCAMETRTAAMARMRADVHRHLMVSVIVKIV